MTKQGTPVEDSARNPAMAALCAASGTSSPTQDSNRSPRMYKAEAYGASVARKLKKCSMTAGRLASMCRSEINSAGDTGSLAA
jgi:hypothetical protein